MTTTTVARLYGARDLRIESSELPSVGASDVLVRITGIGVCGSDMHYFAEGRNGTNIVRTPTVLGHEGSGVVEAVGQDVSLTPGDLVAIEPARGCGSCEVCLSGRYNICPTGTCLGSHPTDGVMAERKVIAEANLHLVPAGFDPVLAAAIEPLSVAVWAVRRAAVGLGHSVLVTGAGPIGLLVAQVARLAGATCVTVTDLADERLAVARELGVTRAVNTATENLGPDEYDRVIECTGVPAVLWDAIGRTAPGGRVTVVGQAEASVDGLPLARLQRFEIDLVCAFRYAHAYSTAIALASSGAIDLARIITGRFPLERAAEAVEAPILDRSHLKVLVTP